MEAYNQEHDVPHGTGSRSSTLQWPLQLARMLAQQSEAGAFFDDGAMRELLVSVMEDPMNGTPPASEDAIRNLSTINVVPKTDAEEETMPACPICTETFEFNEPAKKMPCAHIFHADCVIPWLKRHCSCPLCREEIQSNDADYEDLKRARKRRTAVAQMQNMMYN